MLTTLFVIAWNAVMAITIAHDLRQPSIIGPFNDTTIRAGCHWRVEFGTAPDGMPYSRVWLDVLCYDNSQPLLPIAN